MLRSQSSRRSNHMSAKKWCFCIDFRFGTIMLAVFQIIVHLLCMGFLMLLVVRPTLVHEIISHFHTIQHHSDTHNSPSSINHVDSNAHLRTQYSFSPTFHMLIFGRQQTWIVKDKDGKTHAVVLHQISKPLLLPMDASNSNKGLFAIPSRSRRSAEEPERNPPPSRNVALPFPGKIRAEPLRMEESKSISHIQTKKSSEPSHYSFGCHHKRHHMFALICLWISLCFSCSLLYGAAMRRPIFMMPYLIVQLVGFFFFLVGLLHSYSYLPYIKEWIAHKEHLPFKRTMLKMSELQLALIFLSLSWSVLLVKLNLLALVWGCYRMLRVEQLRERVIQRRAREAPRAAVDSDGSVKVLIDGPALVFLDDPEKNNGEIKNDKEQPPPYKPENEPAEANEKGEDAPLVEA